MHVEPKDILGLLTFVLAVAGQTWGIVHYLIKRQDEHKEALERKIHEARLKAESDVVTIYKRVDEVKENYVKRAELDREFNNLKTYMSEMKEDFHRSLTSVGTRLDQVVALLSRKQPE